MPGAAVGTSGGTVGIDTNHLGFRMLDVISPCSRSAGIDRWNTWSHTHRISTDISNDACSESQDPAIPLRCQLGILDLITSVGSREEALASSLYPGAGPACSHRQKGA